MLHRRKRVGHGGRRTLGVRKPEPRPIGQSVSVGTVTVVVGEDSLLVRQGLLSLLADLDDIEVRASAGTHDEVLAAALEHDPDLVLTDIRMPPTGTDEGIRIARALRESHPAMGVLVLSQWVTPAYALDLLEDGSNGRGYLLKERVADVHHLESAIRAVASGGSFIDPLVVDALVSARSRTGDGALRSLTPREGQILSEMAKGVSNAAIAAGFGVSERAVEKHVSSIFLKLGLFDEPGTHRRVRAALLFLMGKGIDA